MNFFNLFSEYPNKIGFEDIKSVISNNNKLTIIINTLPFDDQSCLIKSTILCNNEEKIINEFMKKNDYKTNIIIYGKNASDNSVYNKYNQLKSIGFSNIYIYSGGLFEWLLLQDIYGFSEFPTTKQKVDILKYRELPVF